MVAIAWIDSRLRSFPLPQDIPIEFRLRHPMGMSLFYKETVAASPVLYLEC